MGVRRLPSEEVIFDGEYDIRGDGELRRYFVSCVVLYEVVDESYDDAFGTVRRKPYRVVHSWDERTVEAMDAETDEVISFREFPDVVKVAMFRDLGRKFLEEDELGRERVLV